MRSTRGLLSVVIGVSVLNTGCVALNELAMNNPSIGLGIALGGLAVSAWNASENSKAAAINAQGTKASISASESLRKLNDEQRRHMEVQREASCINHMIETKLIHRTLCAGFSVKDICIYGYRQAKKVNAVNFCKPYLISTRYGISN